MPINPVEIKENGTVVVLHTEKEHTANLKIDDIKFGVNIMNGEDNEKELIISCPTCTGKDATTSVHPVNGGSAPEMVQRLFAFKFAEADRKQRKAKKHDFTNIKDKLKQMIYDQDGPDRWKLEDHIDKPENIFTSHEKIERARFDKVVQEGKK